MALVEVRYKGIADERYITVKDLAGVGVKIDKNLEWTRANRFKQVIDANDDLIEVLKGEGHFTISEVKDSGAAGPVIAVASDPEREGDVIVDGDSGAKTPAKGSKQS